MSSPAPSAPAVAIIGDNPTRLWGMTNAERIRRIARQHALPLAEDARGSAPRLLVDARFAFDPPLLRHMADTPDTALVTDGRAVIANVTDAAQAERIAAAMAASAPLPADAGPARIDYDAGFELYNRTLRKRERPFVTLLTPQTAPAIERASYYAAYKGVTDILTKYLWPSWALVLTRIAARIGLSPNAVTAIGALFCVLATALFWEGHYWAGMAAGLVFMVLDTVDGKLARCTITSSHWGNIFDHGIDLVHPVFWWLAWAEGLDHWGLAYTPEQFVWIMTAIFGGYIVQRVIEGIFIRRFGMHIHVWEKFDSDFRLITARRNPNMVILFAATLFARPDLGLELLAWWTILSCLIHAVRLAQAFARARRGPLSSWLG